MKNCRKCGQLKSMDDFFKDKSQSDGRNTMCRVCWKDIRYVRYEKRKYVELARIQQRKKTIRKKLTEIKVETGCQRCGENHPACLDFHHVDPASKTIDPSNIANQGWGNDRIEKELENCEVLCSNCHRKEHYLP